jgi:hypothetical protein
MTNQQHFANMIKMAKSIEAAMTESEFAKWMSIPEQARKDTFFEMYWTLEKAAAQ